MNMEVKLDSIVRDRDVVIWKVWRVEIVLNAVE